eukprot:m.318833 g.318833  ORF g.318833 m.318833 type:complete len:132 (-) comp15990_c0_seq38:2455-2850(-)
MPQIATSQFNPAINAVFRPCCVPCILPCLLSNRVDDAPPTLLCDDKEGLQLSIHNDQRQSAFVILQHIAERCKAVCLFVRVELQLVSYEYKLSTHTLVPCYTCDNHPPSLGTLSCGQVALSNDVASRYIQR